MAFMVFWIMGVLLLLCWISGQDRPDSQQCQGPLAAFTGQ